MRICSSLNLHYHSKENISEYIKAGLDFHKENGFDAADFNTGILNLTCDGWQSHIEKAIIDAENVGIKFELCHLPFFCGGLKENAELVSKISKKIHNAIDAAALLGVDYAVLHPGTNTEPIEIFDRDEQYDLVMNHLFPFVEHASKVGLNLAVENMRITKNGTQGRRFGQSPEEICDIADALGIGVCWDFGHANISEVKQSEGLSYVGKRLKVIHVNDNFGEDDEHLAPFMGNIDWRDAMKGLVLAKFDGLLNYEVSTGKFPGSTRVSYAKYLIDAANELISYMNENTL